MTNAIDETVAFIRRIAQHASPSYREMQDGIADALEHTGSISPRQANAVVTGANRQRVDIPPHVLDCLRSNGGDTDTNAPSPDTSIRQEFQKDLQEVTSLLARLIAKWS